MGLDKNLEFVNEESLKLNGCYKQFGDLHEEIQELLTEEEQKIDSQVYENLYNEVHLLRGAVQKWMVEASRRISEERVERRSSKSSVKTQNSKVSRASTTSSKAKALHAKARQAELEARIAQLDQVEAAKKEAERVKLKAEFAAAAAISKVYENATKEDEEQYLGCDDPDIDDPYTSHWSKPKRQPEGFNSQETFVKERKPSSPRASDLDLEHPSDPAAKQLKDTLNPEAPEFILATTPPQQGVVTSGGGTVNRDIAEGRTNTAAWTNSGPQTGFWEKMELRMTQPPPAPTPFDGDPVKYLRFRANFRDQVESRASLTDSEKMNYLIN